MVYKRYIKKGGKKFGPYYFESYRENGNVKKKYIGSEEEYREWKKKNKSSGVGKPLNFLVNKTALKFFLVFLVLGFLLFTFLLFNSSFTGYVISENEKIISSFEKETNLFVKGAPVIGGKIISKNKNERMEFSGGSDNIRLYFDLLNYSEFKNSVNSEYLNEVDSSEQTGYGFYDGVTGFFSKAFNNFLVLTGRVIDGQSIFDSKLEEIDENSKLDISEGEFEVDVDENAEEVLSGEVDYKWGYNVKLKDLNFMAKIEITSDEEIRIYSEDSLIIGNQLLSFKDLVERGYSVRFEKPLILDSLIDEILEENLSGVDMVDEEGVGGEVILGDEEEFEEILEFGYGFEGEQTGYGVLGFVTGMVINNFELSDLEYTNKINVYIERDFTNNSEEIVVGDTIYLDPTLVLIEISNAIHLDVDKNFISDIYDYVNEKDDNWSEIISDGDYVRVRFEENLSLGKDITIYARGDNSVVEVYHEGDNEVIGEFEIFGEGEYKIYPNFKFSGDVFDLKSVGDVEYDWIVDPVENESISFVLPTLLNGAVTTNTSVEINVSIVESDLNEVKYNWNNTNYTLFDDSLVLMYNFDNLSSLGENDSRVVDVSGGENNGSVVDVSWNVTGGRYDGAFNFDGNGGMSVVSSTTINSATGAGQPRTWMYWMYYQGGANKIITDKSIFTGKHFWSESQSTYIQGGVAVSGAVSTGTIALNTWHHLVFTYNGTHTRLYLNGVLKSGPNAQTAPVDDANSILIMEYSSYDCVGRLDNFRIWNRSLSASEIYQQYVSNLQKYNPTQWYLYVNQSKNSTVGLDYGTYDYFAFVKDGSGNGNMTELRSVTIQAPDTTYPIFSSYYDNNASLVDSGLGLFNVSVLNSNGTVLLEIDGSNYTATNLTASVYNVSVSFTSNGSYDYRWHSWGNGSDELYNVSGERSYFVNITPQIGLEILYSVDFNGMNVTQNEFFNISVNVSCLVGDCGEVNVSLDPEFSLYFDFDDDASPATKSGYTQILKSTTYSLDPGYGWEVTTGLDSRDRGDYDDVYEDLIFANVNHSFRVDLTNGNYNVTCYFGDGSNSHDNIYIYANGVEKISDVDVASGTSGFQQQSFEVTIVDGMLNLTIEDRAGSDPNWIWNGFDIVSLDVDKSLINITVGATPFYTNVSNPFNLSLSEGESEVVTWWVNATGEVGTNHTFFAYVNKTSDMSISNISDSWNVSIVSGSVSLGLSLSQSLSQQINWSFVSLPVVNQSANFNNGSGVSSYFVNVSVSGGTADLYVKASGDLLTSGGDVLGLGNETISYNVTNSSVPSESKYSLTTNYLDNLIGEGLTDGQSVYLKFFLNAPSGQAAGSYNNSLMFKIVPNGESP